MIISKLIKLHRNLTDVDFFPLCDFETIDKKKETINYGDGFVAEEYKIEIKFTLKVHQLAILSAETIPIDIHKGYSIGLEKQAFQFLPNTINLSLHSRGPHPENLIELIKIHQLKFNF